MSIEKLSDTKVWWTRKKNVVKIGNNERTREKRTYKEARKHIQTHAHVHIYIHTSVCMYDICVCVSVCDAECMHHTYIDQDKGCGHATLRREETRAMNEQVQICIISVFG